jgi:hypothetical protein
MNRSFASLMGASLVAVAGVLGACGSDDSGSTFLPDGGTSGDRDGSAGGDAFDDAPSFGDNVTSVSIVPSDPVVDVVNGAVPAPIAFTAVGKTAQGQTVPVTGSWTYDRFDVATMSQLGGALTATGFVGGVGNVTFKYKSLSAKTTATVRLKMTADPQGIDNTIKAKFTGATDPDPALSLVYPYDKTVFPRGLTSPVVQWNGGAAADVYHVTLTAKTASFETWMTAAPPSRYSMPILPIDVWKKITDSTAGDLKVAIQRYDGTKAYLAKTQTWTVAPANLTGTIYFWEVNNGNVVRIEPGAAAPQSFLQKPSGATCVACHSVSKNGQKLVASFNGGASPWGTFDTQTGNALFTSDTSQGATYASGFEAISPDGAFVLWRHWSDASFGSLGHLSLSTFDNPAELAQLNAGAGAPSHPTWSGDGKKIAFSVRTDGNGLDFNTSTLWITDVDLAAKTFTNTKKIVDNTAARTTTTYPAFSADDQWLAFERSTQARSRGGHSEIWLSKTDGTGQIALDNTNGAGVITQTDANYEPTFMPVAVGGYFWLIIVSERTYGNTLVDVDPNTRHKQLWVTAIDAAPQPGKDPSHPSFWLPGQDIGNQNMRGEWALSPCKALGVSCQAGFECCDGFCRGDDGGAPVCQKKPVGCVATGDKCTTAADCCTAGASCVGGFCNDSPR